MSSYEYQPPKKIKKGHFLENLKITKNAQKHFLFKIWMFSNIIDLLNHYIVNKYFFIFNILPPGIFCKFYL